MRSPAVDKPPPVSADARGSASVTENILDVTRLPISRERFNVSMLNSGGEVGRPSALIIAIACGVMSSTSYSCTLDAFGNHPQPPAALRPPPVNNTYAHFSFGSDVWTDQKSGDYYAWNFIENDRLPGFSR